MLKTKIALAAVAATALLAAPAHASPFSFPGERDALGVAPMAQLNAYLATWWKVRGFPPCEAGSGLRLMLAPDLAMSDGAAGGRSAECDVWMLESTVANAMNPALYDVYGDGWLIQLCAQTAHEEGHTAVYLAKLAGRLPQDLDDHAWMRENHQAAWERDCIDWADRYMLPPDAGQTVALASGVAYEATAPSRGPRKGRAVPLGTTSEAARTRSSQRAAARRFHRLQRLAQARR